MSSLRDYALIENSRMISCNLFVSDNIVPGFSINEYVLKGKLICYLILYLS